MIAAVGRTVLGFNLQQHTKDPWPPRRPHAVPPPRLVLAPLLADSERGRAGRLVDLAA